MRLVDGHDTGQISSEHVFYTVFADGRIQYTQAGMKEFGPMFRRHGIDIRSIGSEADHDTAYWVCLEQDLKNSLLRMAQMDAIDRKIMEHISEFHFYRGQGKRSLAQMHEEAIYALKGLTTPEEKQVFYDEVLSKEPT
jgi:hypothetical protein